MSSDDDKQDLRRVLIKYTDLQEPDEIIEIPDDWKMTFGPWSPRNRSDTPRTYTEGDNQRKPGWILRIYEGKEQQRAVFTNVESFRDLSIPVFRKKITVVPMGKDEVHEEKVTEDMSDYQIVDQEF